MATARTVRAPDDDDESYSKLLSEGPLDEELQVESPPEEQPKGRCATLRKHMTPVNILKLAAVCLVGIAILVGLILLLKFGILQDLMEKIRALGPWGIVVIGITTMISTVPPLPGYAIFLMGAGFLYGWLGLVPAVIGADVGALLVFVVGRRWARPCIERRIKDNKRIALFDEALSMNAFKFVTLLRITPIPFNWQNIFLAATKVHFKFYLAGTLLGALLEQVLLVYVGTTLGDLSQLDTIEWTPSRIALFVCQGVAMIVVVTAVAIYVRRNYNAMMAAAEAKQALEAREREEGADTLAEQPSASSP